MKLQLPYGRKTLSIEIADPRPVHVLYSRLDAYKPEQSESALVRQSMRHPIGTPGLAELSKGKQKVVIITSDHTRPLPSRHILPLILQEIRAGNPQAEITILVATGCHRETSREELREKLREDIFSREKIVVHDCQDKKNLLYVDRLPSGGELFLNRLAVEADLLLAEGLIEPHFFAGFSGGRKSVLPGVASREAVYYNHNAAFIEDPHARTGVLDNNPIHRDMLFAAKRVGLAYIVNVIINAQKKVVASFAGESERAHREGCRFFEKIASTPPVPSDIVITTNNGYPLDQNLYQAVKGMCTAEATCNPGGVIIAVAACEDGVGGDGFHQTFRNAASAEELLEIFRSRSAAETVEDQWQSQIFARILSKYRVILVSGLPDAVVRDFHMLPAKTVEEAMQMADGILQKENAGVCVIPHGVSTLISAQGS